MPQILVQDLAKALWTIAGAAAGFVFLAASFWAWKAGVGKHTSTGS